MKLEELIKFRDAFTGPYFKGATVGTVHYCLLGTLP